MEYIYHMVGFDRPYIEAAKARRKIDDNYKIWTPEQLKDAKLDYQENHKFGIFVGCNRIGTFSSLEKAQYKIYNSPSTVVDHRYDIILIEKHAIDEIDGGCWGDDDFELWYGVEEIWGEDGYIESVKLVEIDRPDCFRGTGWFA